MAPRGELAGDRANVGVDPVHRGSEHDRRNLSAGARRGEMAIEFPALARADPDVFARHVASSTSCDRRIPYPRAIRLSNLPGWPRIIAKSPIPHRFATCEKKELIHGYQIQNSDHGRLVRLAPRDQARARGAL